MIGTQNIASPRPVSASFEGAPLAGGTRFRGEAHAQSDADPRTFMGSIRWVALGIGVACLALLSLVAGVAHAAPAGDPGVTRHATVVTAPSITALPDIAIPTRTERRRPNDR